MNEDNLPLILYASTRRLLADLLLLLTGKSINKMDHIMNILYTIKSFSGSPYGVCSWF